MRNIFYKFWTDVPEEFADTRIIPDHSRAKPADLFTYHSFQGCDGKSITCDKSLFLRI